MRRILPRTQRQPLSSRIASVLRCSLGATLTATLLPRLIRELALARWPAVFDRVAVACAEGFAARFVGAEVVLRGVVDDGAALVAAVGAAGEGALGEEAEGEGESGDGEMHCGFLCMCVGEE